MIANLNIKEEEIVKYMQLALDQCELALKRGEVPVGCVFLHDPSKEIILTGHNLTNKTKNATTHAEINCINALSDILSDDISKQEFCTRLSIPLDSTVKDIISDCILFVSCEPCIMCAHALCLVNIKRVYFGCENDKFGGNGSILSVNKSNENSYDSLGGYMAQEAIEIFRKFYIRGNEKAPDNKRQRKLISEI